VKGPVICGIEDANDDGVAAVALDLADRYDLQLLFVHVGSDEDGRGDVAQLVREQTATGRADLVIEGGHPADRLIELARDRQAAFLVVGNRGPRSSLLGSISAEVSRRAPAPVLVVPRTASANVPEAAA